MIKNNINIINISIFLICSYIIVLKIIKDSPSKITVIYGSIIGYMFGGFGLWVLYLVLF